MKNYFIFLIESIVSSSSFIKQNWFKMILLTFDNCSTFYFHPISPYSAFPHKQLWKNQLWFYILLKRYFWVCWINFLYKLQVSTISCLWMFVNFIFRIATPLLNLSTHSCLHLESRIHQFWIKIVCTFLRYGV